MDLVSSPEDPEIYISLFSNPHDFLLLPQEEASKAINKKTLEGVTNEKGTENQAMEEEKTEGHV